MTSEYPSSFLPMQSAPHRPHPGFATKGARPDLEDEDDSSSSSPEEEEDEGSDEASAEPVEASDNANAFPPPQAGRYYQSTFQGAGFSFLQQQLLHHSEASAATSSSASSLLPSQRSQELLQGLLKDHGVSLSEETNSNDEYYPRSSRPWKRVKMMAAGSSLSSRIQTTASAASKESLLELARQIPSQMSLLASILQLLDENSTSSDAFTPPEPVLARTFVQQCALAVRPALVPGRMDAKEMVLAALHFLCHTTDLCITDSTQYVPPPPWIRAVQVARDLEKRAYEKVGDWTLGQILPAVAQLENEVFYASAGGTDLKWMPRCRFGPPVLPSVVDEDLLWLRGQPSSQVLKKPGGKTGPGSGGTYGPRGPYAKSTKRPPAIPPTILPAAAVVAATTAATAAVAAATAAAAAVGNAKKMQTVNFLASSGDDPVALEASRIMSETAATTPGTRSQPRTGAVNPAALFSPLTKK